MAMSWCAGKLTSKLIQQLFSKPDAALTQTIVLHKAREQLRRGKKDKRRQPDPSNSASI